MTRKHNLQFLHDLVETNKFFISNFNHSPLDNILKPEDGTTFYFIAGVFCQHENSDINIGLRHTFEEQFTNIEVVKRSPNQPYKFKTRSLKVVGQTQKNENPDIQNDFISITTRVTEVSTQSTDSSSTIYGYLRNTRAIQ